MIEMKSDTVQLDAALQQLRRNDLSINYYTCYERHLFNTYTAHNLMSEEWSIQASPRCKVDHFKHKTLSPAPLSQYRASQSGEMGLLLVRDHTSHIPLHVTCLKTSCLEGCLYDVDR